MIIVAIALLAAAAAGFGIGRIKNAAKLKAISAEIANVEGKVSSTAEAALVDASAALKNIKAKL